MPHTAESREATRLRNKERNRQKYLANREALLEKQKAYNREKREEANKAKGIERVPYGHVKKMSDEERGAFFRARWKRYNQTRRETTEWTRALTEVEEEWTRALTEVEDELTLEVAEMDEEWTRALAVVELRMKRREYMRRWRAKRKEITEVTIPMA